MQSLPTTLQQPQTTPPIKAGISWEVLLSEYSSFENEVENGNTKQALREHDYCWEVFKLVKEEDKIGELYQVKEIEGKGRGIFASKFIKKGTLILKEEPQIPKIQMPPTFAQWDWSKLDQLNVFQQKEYLEQKYKSDSGMKLELEGYVQSMVSLYEQMCECNQRWIYTSTFVKNCPLVQTLDFHLSSFSFFWLL